jgi:hypothetical protein
MELVQRLSMNLSFFSLLTLSPPTRCCEALPSPKLRDPVFMPQLLDKTIEILSVKHLRGPNMWTYHPVIEVWVDIGDLEDYPSQPNPRIFMSG